MLYKGVMKRSPQEFFATGKRGLRGVERSPLHILLTPLERARLVKLTKIMKLTASDVVRALIAEAI